jgi:hypothetical protein
MQEITKMNILDNIYLATPCPANWDDMEGNDQMRHCQLCSLNVYNLEAFSSEDAAKLIGKKAESGERICARFYRRADGKVMTADCPRGTAKVREKLNKLRRKILSSLAMLVGVSPAFAQTKESADGSKAGPPHVAMPGMIAISLPWNPCATSTARELVQQNKYQKLAADGKTMSKEAATVLIDLAQVFKEEAAAEPGKALEYRGKASICLNNAKNILDKQKDAALMKRLTNLQASLAEKQK